METKKHRSPILSIIFLCILFIAEGITVYIIHSANILPGKYFSLIPAVLLFISIPIVLLLLVHGKNKARPVGRVRRIIAYILIIIVCIGCICVSKIFSTLSNTFSTVTDSSAIVSHYGVYVSAGDSAEKIEDTAGYSYGAVSGFDAENTETVINEIESLTGSEIAVRYFENPYEMIDGLLSHELEAVIMDNSYLDIIEELEQYSDFPETTKCIFDYELKTELRPQFDFAPPEPVVEKGPSETPFVMYLSGTDARYNVSSKNRSDVNILAVINPETEQILLINTPRDYYIANPAADGAKDKLTHLGLYGVDCSAKGLSDLYAVPVSYTARINFTGFERLIDAIGGITVRPAETDETYYWQTEINLDGRSALDFARNRGFNGGDRVRGRHQMDIIRAIADKLMSGAILSSYSDIMESLEGMFITDMPSDVITELIKMQIDEMPGWNFISYSVDGTGSQLPTYSIPGLYSYCMEPDMGTVQHASELINLVLDGAVLSPEDLVYKAEG